MREPHDSALLQLATLFPVPLSLQFHVLSLNKEGSRGYFLEEHLQTDKKLIFFLIVFSLMRKATLFVFEEK